jgi:hypothetical protein
VAPSIELGPEEIDLIVEALTVSRERWEGYLPGMRQKEEARPTQITPAQANEKVQRCNALIRLLSDYLRRNE